MGHISPKAIIDPPKILKKSMRALKPKNCEARR